MIEKLEECPGCGAATKPEGWHYDLQTCDQCHGGRIPWLPGGSEDGTIVLCVEVPMPETHTVSDMVAYVQEAVSWWAGQDRPDTPLFQEIYNHKERVKVRPVPIHPMQYGLQVALREAMEQVIREKRVELAQEIADLLASFHPSPPDVEGRGRPD